MTWTRAALPVVLAAAWVAGVYGCVSWSGADYAERHTVEISDLAHPRVTALNDLNYDAARRTVRATGEQPSLVIRSESARESLWAIVLRLEPGRSMPEDGFFAYRIPPGVLKDESDRMHHYCVTRGSVVRDQSGLSVRWNFPEATRGCRLQFPPGASFELLSLALVEGPEEAPAGTLLSIKQHLRALSAGMALWGLVLCLWLAFPQTRVRPETIRAAVLVGLVAALGIAAALTPPFQGPDEWRHWKTSLETCRKGAAEESALFNLPETTNAIRLRHRSENQFDARQLLAPPDAEGLPRSMWYQTGYGTRFTYPFVGVVSLLFPRVETTSEALTFYYLCRALPAALLVALVFAAFRMRLLSWTAVVFLSSPLLQQQFTTITSDTMPNLGTLAALLLFAAYRSLPRRAVLAALWVVSLWVAVSKPPISFCVLLLPLQLTSIRSVPYRRVVIAVTGIALFLLAAWVANKCMVAFHNSAPDSWIGQRRAQVLSGEAPGEFLAALQRLVATTNWVDAWFGPLGWLDTFFTQRHATLIRLSVWLALAVDLCVIVPGLARRMMDDRRRALVTLACIAGHGLYLYLVTSIIMFMVATPPTSPMIIGVQMRYMFPWLMLALLLPLAAFGNPEATAASRERGELLRLIAGSAAATLLPWLLFTRQVETTTTLLSRFW